MNKSLSLAGYIFSSPSKTAAFLFSEIPVWFVLILLFSGAISPAAAVLMVLIIFMSRAVIKSLITDNVYSCFFSEIMISVFTLFSLIIFSVLIISSAVAIVISGNGILTTVLLIFIITFSIFHAVLIKPDLMKKLWGTNIKTPSTFFYDLLINLSWLTIILSYGRAAYIIFTILILILLQYRKMMKMYESVL